MALTSSQLKRLRALPHDGNRVAAAIELMGVTQQQVADGIGATQPYVSAVARNQHDTITLENARKFITFFGCEIDDLFPERQVA